MVRFLDQYEDGSGETIRGLLFWQVGKYRTGRDLTRHLKNSGVVGSQATVQSSKARPFAVSS